MAGLAPEIHRWLRPASMKTADGFVFPTHPHHVTKLGASFPNKGPTPP